MKNICTFILFTLVALNSCNTEDTSANNPSTDLTTVSKKTTETAGYRYAITTTDINSKLNPTSSAKTQIRIKKNTIVKLLNETSEFEDTLSINKRRMVEPYEKVNILTTKMDTWIFSGALKSIYTGEKDIADADNIQAFFTLVSSQDPSDYSSGKKVISKLQELTSKDIATNDAMFFIAYDYVNQLARSSKTHSNLIAQHPWTLDDYNEIINGTIDISHHPIGKVLHENGLALDGALGEILVKSDISILADAVNNQVSQSVKDYIDMIKLSTKSKIFDNNNIIAPLSSVANQANLWSKFAKDHSNFAHISNVKMKSSRLTEALLSGTKSTPAFDYKTRVAKPEYREIWNYVLKYYDETPLAVEVKSHTKWLESRDWKFPEEKHVH